MHGGGGDTEDSRGVVPRAMEVVFAQIQSEKQNGTGKIELAISCLEIYQEKLFDLLQEENKAPSHSANHSNLRIRQRQNGEVWVEVRLERLSCLRDKLRVMRCGEVWCDVM